MFVDNEANDKNCFSLTYNPDVPCIEFIFEGYATSEEFRTRTEELLNSINTYRVNKVLADPTYMKLLALEDQNWFIYNWLPRAVKAGYGACAMLQPKYFFNKIAIQNIAGALNESVFTLRLFDRKEEALAWLRAYKVNALKSLKWIS